MFMLVAVSACLNQNLNLAIGLPLSQPYAIAAFAASFVVASGHLMRWSFLQRAARLVGASVFFWGGLITAEAGLYAPATVLVAFGLALTLAVVFGGVPKEPEEKPLPELATLAPLAGILLVWGLGGLMGNLDLVAGLPGLVMGLAALLGAAALILVIWRRPQVWYWRALAALPGLAVFVVEAIANVRAGAPACAVVYSLLGLTLILAIFATRFALNCASSVLSQLTDRQYQIYRQRRFGELVAIILFGINGLIAVIYGSSSIPSAYGGLIGIYFLVIVAYHFDFLSGALTERRYGLVLFGYLAAAILAIQGTGGFESPLASTMFVLLITSLTALSVSWAWGIVLTSVTYLTASFLAAWATGSVTQSQLLHFLALVFGLLIAGYYGAMMLRDREGYEQRLRQTTEKLMEALAAASREKGRFEQQTKQLQELNSDLVDTRTALLNVLEDVEESKLRIERVARRDAAIFASLGEGMIAATADRKVFLHNQAMARLTGFGGDAAIGQDIGEVLKFVREVDNQPDVQMLEAVFAGKPATCPDKIEIVARNGQRIPVAGSASPFFDEANKLQGVVIALRDITVQRDINRQRSGFISIASHQLRTPLSATRWYLDVLQAGDVGPVTKEQGDLLSDLQTSNVRMIKLVNDLLDVNRIESGRVQPKPAMTDVKPILESIIKEHLALAQNKKQKLDTDFASGLPELFVDPEGVRQAVANLVANAINYTPIGGQIKVTYGQVGEEAVIEVKDTGIGVPESQKHRLFTQFFRADNAVATETIGSGLGLYITKLMVEASGGRIWFESKSGEGSRFFVAFPLKLAVKK